MVGINIKQLGDSYLQFQVREVDRLNFLRNKLNLYLQTKLGFDNQERTSKDSKCDS